MVASDVQVLEFGWNCIDLSSTVFGLKVPQSSPATVEGHRKVQLQIKN